MDDKRLQSEFDGYFSGANLPDNMTADAKAQVRPRKREIRKWFLRLAPIAAAFILIVSVSVVFINRFMPSNVSGGSNAGSAPPPSDGSAKYVYYTAETLSSKRMDPYASTDIDGLEFVYDLTQVPNSNIYLTVFFQNENMVLAKAEISLLHNGYRHDTVLYAEYTNEYFDELKEFLDGDERRYLGYEYLYTLDYDGGEQVYKIYMQDGGVKYYLSVMTSEPDGYGIYLNFLKNY